MLIDFAPVLKVLCECPLSSELMADLVQISVFSLGRTYQKIVKALMIQKHGVIDTINPENLIYRFAKKLEFGQDMYRVARDACLVLQRMDRDWITIGRRPAGVCGAAIIIAARMNNYRRNTREVTYVVKVADVTILQRLDEFKKTRASQMTVSEFRNHSHTLTEAHDPPAYSRQFEKKKKRRVRRRLETGTAADEQSDSAETESEGEENMASDDDNQQGSNQHRSKQQGRKRTHSQANKSQAIPIDPALLPAGEEASNPKAPQSAPQDPNQRISEIVEEEIVANPQVAEDSDDIPTSLNPAKGKGKAKPSPDPNEPALTVGAKRKRGRPRKDGSSAATAVPPSLGKTPRPIPRASSQLPIAEDTLASILEGDAQEESSSAQAQATAQVAADQAAMPPPPPRRVKPAFPDINDEEFADDAEVNDCLLTEAETAVKERIWLHENGEYLRAQEAKRIKRELAEANGTVKEVKKKKKKKNKRGRLGDASQYHTVNEDGTVSGPATPAEAVEMMMRQRAFSRKINYEAVEKLYGGPVKDRGDEVEKGDSQNADGEGDQGAGASAAEGQAGVGGSPAAEELDRLAADFGDENEDPDPDEEGGYDENDYV